MNPDIRNEKPIQVIGLHHAWSYPYEPQYSKWYADRVQHKLQNIFGWAGQAAPKVVLPRWQVVMLHAGQPRS